MEHPAYYSIIPASVRYNDNLSANAKLLYGEITALANARGFCWASNSYFANLYRVSIESVKRWMRQLKESGYIRVEIVTRGSNTERHIYVLDDPQNSMTQGGSKMTLGGVKNDPTPRVKNDPNNITSVNITENKEHIVEIVDYLNLKAGKSYRSSTKKTQTLINARLKDGYTVEDFKKVIDKKTSEWLNTEWDKYLRPSTLFDATKFENYLNASAPKRMEFDDEGWL